MELRERLSEDDRLRRGVIGAVSGAVAGLTAVSLESGGSAERFLVALFVGAVVFIALWLLTS
ncbi:hypothetical protein [Halopelagius longus]|uniref:Uncharacterized protein n=1 Tax=Halopelagius longus TaxID=1236180 RepID=A0A1H0Z4D7_9EURY|nr:hypothetical protein [Halopelagius longus]RDI72827.1 hypothetical protein DWB78_14435 [Halopelagius longus]SDQ22315.1 hypothetical protein SAMN05216278_1009 [Halopelagius longus]